MQYYTKFNLGKRVGKNALQEALLDLLDAFDRFCRENDLQYFLSGGTLLGAIRHEGFIPWDDDIDVNMPRSDCEKMERICGGTIGGFPLLPPNADDQHHAYHWKLFNDSVLIFRGKGKSQYRPYPVFIDIFPIEGLPDSEKETERHYKTLNRLKTMAEGTWYPGWFHGRTRKEKLYHAFLRPVALLIGREKLFRQILAHMQKYSYENSRYVGVMATRVHTTEERVLKEEYAKPVPVSFEGRELFGPAGYDTYLRQLYGKNYMQLPPVEKRVSHGYKLYEGVHLGARKIVIAGLIRSMNLGEQFIAKSLEYLIETGLRERGFEEPLGFVEMDLLGRNEAMTAELNYFKNQVLNYENYRLIAFPVTKIYAELAKKQKRTNNPLVKSLIHRIRHFIWETGSNYKKRVKAFYRERCLDADFIVVDGAGLLEYSSNEYHEPLATLSELAEEENLPVVYNAIGQVGEFKENDLRMKIMQRALRSKAVQYISARDSVERVQACAGDRFQVKLLADAAFWMKEAYKPILPETRTKIGIGLIRGSALKSYNVKFSADDWIDLFCGIAKELQKRGYEFEFFTNGLPSDRVIGERVLTELKLPEDYLVPQPTDDRAVYDTIGSYRGIITCRMHSSIAAFTLGTPSVILSWNDKVEKLMDTIGYPERAITRDHFDPVYIVDAFERALEEGVDPENIERMKAKAKESVDAYIDSIYASCTKEKPGVIV